MHKAIHVAFFLLFSIVQKTSFTQALPGSVQRIVFLGNSITWQGNYVNDIAAYLEIKYPDKQWKIMNLGLPSETVSGLSESGHAGGAFPRPDLHERLIRILGQTKPDLVFACYGMNDGIYLPFDNERFQKFKDGINWLHDEVVKTGARIIHLTPPDYDEVKGKSIGYSTVLDRYTDWLLSKKAQSKWEVIDIHYPMKKYTEAHRKIDARMGIDGFALAQDGIHPGETGHWIMAKQVLLYLGYKEIKAAGTIDEAISQIPNAATVIKQVAQRQNLMRDAWLTATKHKRPGLPVGFPLNEAHLIAEEKTKEITSLIQNKKIVEVYLIGGQSNATGQGYVENMADSMKINTKLMIFHSGQPHLNSGLPAYTLQPMHQASESPDRFGPELGFSSAIKSSLPNSQIAVIKHAHSGTNLYSEWNPGKNAGDIANWGFQFQEFVKTVHAGLDSLRQRGFEPIVKGMLWQQGEQEAFAVDSISVQYGILLQHFIARVREQLQAPQMIFVYGYVCPPPLIGRGIKTVRQAQHDVDQDSGMSLAVKRAFVIPTDDLSHRANDRNTKYPKDHLHFGTDGVWVLGLRMAEKINQQFR